MSIATEMGNRPSTHRWRFFRAGGLDMVRLETADDLRHLANLDLKLWTALACPVNGLEFDDTTLKLLDANHDGRIRAEEIKDAVAWVCQVLKDPAAIYRADGELALEEIADPALRASAEEIVRQMNRTDGRISLKEASGKASYLAQTRFNGDGVVTVASAGDDAATVQVINELVAATGGTLDRSGQKGADAASLATFQAALEGFSQWHIEADKRAAELLPLGPATAAGAEILQQVRAKIDDYFARCRLAAFDSRAKSALNRQEAEYLALAAQDLKITAEEILHFPLARIEGRQPLPLTDSLNPGWADLIDRFAQQVVHPLLGEDLTTLHEDDWATLKARFAPYEAWKAAKAGTIVEPLGLARVREILAGESLKRIAALIEEDLKQAPVFSAIASVEKLLRYQRDLFPLLRNFVNFADFYSRQRLATFQAGTLYLDSRACELVVRVADPGKHAALAGFSKAYLAYCDCVRPNTGEKMGIAAAFTNGDADQLLVGRNGVFYDRQGRDWDATITKVIENPISIREAFFSPYKKFIRLIEEFVAKRAAAAEGASQARLSSVAEAAANADKGVKPPDKKPFDVGVVAALGVALGSIGTFMAAILTRFIELGPWIPVALVVILLLISGPSMVIAALKLRLRNLGPILDANGWAVNGRVRINIPFGTSLTARAKLPPGSEKTLRDPYAQRGTPWWLWGLLLVLLGAGSWFVYKYEQTGRWDYWNQPEPAPVELPAPTTPAPE